MQIDMDLYLKYLTDKFKSNGMFQLKPITAVLTLVSQVECCCRVGVKTSLI